jgi:hypothetical protein
MKKLVTLADQFVIAISHCHLSAFQHGAWHMSRYEVNGHRDKQQPRVLGGK